MSGVATAIVGTAVVGSIISSNASKSAAQTQADAANNATAANTAATQEQIALSEPWRKSGEKALNQLSEMTQPGGIATKDFAYGPFAYQADPGYAFRLKEGMNAMNATAAARGGLISGNALKAGQIYGQEMGSQEYGNAFNRYLSNYSNAQNTFQLNRNNLLEPLKFLSGQGQAAAAGQASNIGANAQANAALSTGAANATAAGQIGSANAFTGAASNAIGQYQLYNALNKSAYSSPSSGYNYYGANGGNYGPTAEGGNLVTVP